MFSMISLINVQIVISVLRIWWVKLRNKLNPNGELIQFKI